MTRQFSPDIFVIFFSLVLSSMGVYTVYWYSVIKLLSVFSTFSLLFPYFPKNSFPSDNSQKCLLFPFRFLTSRAFLTVTDWESGMMG